MRIIKEKTLKYLLTIDRYKPAGNHLSVLVNELKKAEFDTHNELKEKYGNASIIGSKRVVFNVKGNDYRLITDIEYKLKIVFIIWFGTHDEYDKIDAKTVKYED